MADDAYQSDPSYRPYCLWLDQSPNGNTAEVWITPTKGQCGVVGKWNGRACWNVPATSVAEAERIGWTKWEELHNPPERREPEPQEPVKWTPPGLMWAN